MPSIGLGKVSITPRGKYDPTVGYKFLDMVELDGSSYMALKDVAGVTPTDGEDWMLVAQRGDTGQQGVQGETGEQGPPGNVMYATFDIDPATGKLTMTTPDGYSGPNFAINNDGHLEVMI